MEKVSKLLTFVCFFGLGKFYSIFAIPNCELSFAYRQLCPNPMFVTGAGGNGGSVPNLDSSIDLRNTPRGYSRNLNEPTSSCSFFKDLNEASVISGIHVSEEQWSFRGSNKCNHVVKFLVDPDRNGNSGPPICKREIGMRVVNLNEEDRWNVYVWHNFTFGSFQAKYADSITNHGYSKWDVSCTSKQQFVQIIILTSRNSKCSLLVQQYRISKSRDGCESLQTPDSFLPFQFCGAYDCSEANNILQRMKLTGRDHPLEPHVDPDEESPTYTSGLDSPSPGLKVSDGDVGDPDDDENGKEESTTESDESSRENLYKAQKEAEFGEWAVKLFFPAFGILFIFFLLSILRGSYAKQICGRGEFGSHYHGSTISVEKERLQL